MLVNNKIVGGGFTGRKEYIEVEYDFAKDGGAISALTAITAEKKCVAKLEHLEVEAAVLSAGALTMNIGKGDAGVEFMSAKGKADLTLDSIHMADAPAGVLLDEGDTVTMQIVAAAATAGKMKMIFSIMK